MLPPTSVYEELTKTMDALPEAMSAVEAGLTSPDSETRNAAGIARGRLQDLAAKISEVRKVSAVGKPGRLA